MATPDPNRATPPNAPTDRTDRTDRTAPTDRIAPTDRTAPGEHDPRELVARRMRYAASGDREAEMALFAPDAVVEFPFAPEGVPARIEGRDAIRRMSDLLDTRRGVDLRVVSTSRNHAVHETTTPGVVVSELDAEIELPATGERSRLRQVHVYEIRDGLIAHVRDYFGPDSARFVSAALGSE